MIREWRRLARTIGPVLGAGVLGLASTLAIAWGIALRGPAAVDEGVSFRDRRSADGEGLGRIVLRWSRAPGLTSYQATVYPTCISTSGADDASPEEVLPRWARAEVLPWSVGRRAWPEGSGEEATSGIRVYGWPFPSMWGEFAAGGRSVAWAERVPTRPLWRGLAMDSVLLGAVWWVVIVTPGLAVWTVRAWRGCCMVCGYSLEGLPEPGPRSPCCPECGAERPRAAGARTRGVFVGA